MIASLKTIGKPAEEILSLLQETLAQWLPTQDATSSDLETSGLGYAGWLDPVLTAQDGTRTRIRDPFGIGSATMNLRRAMADPERGAWTWAHLWMSADELVLHAEYDWNRDVGPADFNCADELKRFPRDAQHTPTWLVQGAERARTTPPPHPDENEGVYQAITEQERDARRNS